ncbi:MAG: apolipoprotein N-acyltransferase [Deltaproteobacteria bacterium]|nr:apolipoprotein N-acyltransferase [Deltaproteobacteria bacterium]
MTEAVSLEDGAKSLPLTDQASAEQPLGPWLAPRWAALSAALGGVALYLSAPPLMLWPLCFVGSLLLALALEGRRARSSFGLGLLCAFFYWIFAAPWLVGTVERFAGLSRAVGVVLFLLFCVGQSLMLAVQSAVAASLRKSVGRVLAVALATLFAERFVSSVFAWQFAAPLVDAPWIAQSGDVLTVTGISALVHALSAALVARGREIVTGAPTQRRRRIELHATLALFVIASVYGGVRTYQFRSDTSQQTLDVALIQPSVPPLVRWEESAAASILATLHASTRAAIAQNPDLIVWHEGAFPYVLPHQAGRDGVLAPPVYTVQQAPPIVFGLMSAGPGELRYNAAFLRNEDGTFSEPVAKRALVPFGEAVPFAHELPWLARIFVRSGGISPGEGQPLLRTRSGVTLGVLICFEDTLSHVAAAAAPGELLVNLTNDAWFVSPVALEEHLLMARWRSIELRRETVRAVNSGISGRIDVMGHVVARAPMQVSQVLIVRARRYHGWTFAPHFARFAGKIAAIAIFGVWLVQLFRRVRSPR